jgi:hypothetical protein
LDAEYLELFLGKRVKKVYQRRYILTPSADSNEQIMPVARFSDQTGLHDKDSNTGSLIELSLAPMGNLRELRDLNMNYPDPELKNNLYYRIPDQADINVSISGEELLNQRFSVYQIGTLVNMPVIP